MQVTQVLVTRYSTVLLVVGLILGTSTNNGVSVCLFFLAVYLTLLLVVVNDDILHLTHVRFFSVDGHLTLHVVQLSLDLDLVGGGDPRRFGQFELSASAFGSQGRRDGDTQGYDGGGDPHGGSVGGSGLPIDGGDRTVFRYGVDDLGRRRRNHVAQLVGDAGEGGSVGGRGEFVEVDRDHPPGTLDKDCIVSPVLVHKTWKEICGVSNG